MATSTPTSGSHPSPLGIAGLAAVGAGIIHLGIGVGHRDEPVVLALSVSIGLVQAGWGVWALCRRGRAVAIAGAVISAGALMGWAMAKVSGIAAVDALADPEPVGLADGVGALLAFVTLTLAFRAIQVDPARPGPANLPLRRSVIGVGAVALVVCIGVAVLAAARDQPDDELAVAAQSPTLAASVDTRAENRLFDPADPIDLSGVPGVTDQEQERAEAVLSSTLESLPRFADYQAAIDAGYQSLGDAFTGHEHLVNWDLLDDGRTLDADYPESLVYAVDDDGSRSLASAMYMLTPGSRLTTVPDVGGSLTPWHVHENICVTTDPATPTEGGITDASGTCPPGQELFSPVPMLHVWVTPHPCGPFASLESVAGLDVADDEIVFCDHIHGA